MKRITVGALLLLAACGSEQGSELDVVYGSDDRKDVYKVEDEKLAELARSTAILLPTDAIENPNEKEEEGEPGSNPFGSPFGDIFNGILNGLNGSDSGSKDDDSNLPAAPTLPEDTEQEPTQSTEFNWAVQGDTLGEEKNLCEDEPFREQPSPGMCSGFLIGPDLFATAGHCLTRGCDSFKVAFNYFYDKPSEQKNLWEIPNKDIYTCTEIVGSYVDTETKLDFGVIRLDRKVEGVKPVKLRSEGKVKAGTPLAVIGYPMGLPGKVTEGGNTEARKTDERYFFVGNLDTYGGNSGSAVFNAETYEVEGILVRGEDDLVKTAEGCYKTNYCIDRKCRGEDVTRIATLKQFLDTMPKEGDPKKEVVYEHKHLELELPDGDKDGVEIAFRVEEAEELINAKLEIALLHPRPGQVSVKLIHPEGFAIELGSESEAGRSYDLKASYEFLHLRGLSAQGLWRLVLADDTKTRTGYVDSAKLTLTVKADKDEPVDELETVSAEIKSEAGIPVPDKGEGTLTVTFDNLDTDKSVQSLTLATEIEHTYAADLTVTLHSPSGTAFDVFAGGRGSSDDLAVTFGDDVPGFQVAFAGEDAGGEWKVTVKDSGRGDTGKILNLKLTVTLE